MSDKPADDQSSDDASDPKALMREALARKNANHHLSAEAAGKSGPVAGGAHGQVGGKRTFRRKSGG